MACFTNTTAGRKRSEVVSLTPYEHNVDVTPVDFPQPGEPSVRPQDEDQPMNPDDTLQASEEVEVEGEEAIPARGFRLQHSLHAKKFRNTY